MELIELLKSRDPTNHKLAAEMPFSNAEWVEALHGIIDTIGDSKNDGVIHYSEIFKALNFFWFVEDSIVHIGNTSTTRKHLIYDADKIILLRDNDSRIKYLGKENISKAIKKLKHAIRNS